MRILFVGHYALPHLGGIEVAVDALARELGRLGHQVTHLASDSRRRGEELEHHVPNGYRVVGVPAWNPAEHRLGVPWPLFGPQLLPILWREVGKADVVHGHGFLYLSSAMALVLASRTSAVRVITEHVGRVGYSRRLLDRVEQIAIAGLGRFTARSAEGIVVLNEKVRAEMATLAPRAKIVSIPNGVDTSCYRPAEPGERELLRRQLGWDGVPRVLFVGRLVTKKGIHLAVSAVERLNGRVRLVVVGPGELQPGPFVDVMGPIPRSRVAELYRAADIFMLPSRGEGFPLTVQEAMASGLPTILSDDPSYAPYLTDEGTRAVSPEPEALARAVLSFLSPEDRMRAGRAALAKARADFSWAAAARAHLALYECLAEAKSGRQ